MTILPNRDDLAAYLDMVFGYVDPEGTCIALRGTGEKGTSGEGGFVDPVIVSPITSQFDIDRIFGHVQRWSQHGRASFIVPAAVDAVAINDKHATEDRILTLTTIVVDIDKGDTAAKLAFAEKHLGKPSMVVHSGGLTETLSPKLHVYWKLSEASDRVADIAAARKVLALKVGGDASFARSTQVIRLPGSVYAKGDVRRLCKIADTTNYEYELDDILSAIAGMDVCPGVEVDEAKLQPALSFSTGKGLVFSGFQDREHGDIKTALLQPITEGGDEDRNRWGEFNRVAGLHIHQARTGIITIEEAKAHTHTWMLEKMTPAWPPVRFESEWKGLLAHDIKAHGNVPVPLGQQAGQVIDVVPTGMGLHQVAPTLNDWAVSSWVQGEKPKRKFLVDGLVLAGKSHMLAAEGGAGKTFLLLDLAIKIASHSPEQLQSWCGLPLTDDAGGTVVMFTTEDDKDELHIRLSEIDTDGRLKRAGNKLVIIPTINIGGAFPLVERERGTGTAQFGRTWSAWLEQLSKVQDLRLVVIDTLNTTLHGEENNATVINEYVQAAAAIVCGKLGAALVVTHHVRKPGPNIKIYTPEDMKNSIRGSTALIGAFRCTIGIWHAPDFKERLERMGRAGKPGNLYNLAVVKANNPQMAWGIRAMLRQPSGILLDITERESQMIAATQDQAEAWLIKAVEHAAEQGHPFTMKSAMKKPPNGRKHQLPAILKSVSERKIQDLCERLVDDGRLVQCNPKGKTTYNHLDVPNGPLAKAIGSDGGAYRIAEGSDFTPPEWESAYAFHSTEQRIVRRGQEGERAYRGARPEAPQAAQKRPVPNPNTPPVAPGRSTPDAAGRTGRKDGQCDGATGLLFSPNSYLNSDA